MSAQGFAMQDQMEYLKKYRLAMIDLLESIFPHDCEHCGKTYHTYRDLINNTRSVEDAGTVKSETRDEGKRMVRIYRVCNCRQPLHIEVENRRDMSPEGINRRDKFGQVLKVLTAAGIAENDARDELLKVLHGERSEILDRMGMTVSFD